MKPELFDMRSPEQKTLDRIADALERIADVIEAAAPGLRRSTFRSVDGGESR